MTTPRTWLARLATVAALSLASSVDAATVRVQVVDENDLPLRHTEVRLVPDQATVDNVRWWSSNALRATSDDTGVAVFENIAPGQHTITGGRWTRDFVRPEENPLAPPVRLTVDDPGAVVTVRFELHRGTPLFVRFFIDGTNRRVGTVVRMFEQENRHAAETRVFRDEERVYPLIAGRWSIELAPPRGYLLDNVEVDGESIDGYVATVDVRPGSPAVFVTWTFRSPASLSGNVYFEGEPFPLSVRASLVEPGPWWEAVQLRGGSAVELVQAVVDPRDGSYSMDLPDGRWVVAPAGPGLVSAEPAGADVVLVEGEDGRQNFDVSGENVPGTVVNVHVENPRGGPARDAIVELWARDATERGEAPLATAETTSWGMAVLEGVTAGDYVIAAAHPDHLESWVELAGFDPESDDGPVHEVIRLRESATLDVVVDARGKRAPAGTRFTLHRLERSPLQIVRDAEIVKAAMQPSGEPDATGRAVLRGIYSGSYGITGEAETAFVRFEGDPGWHEAVELGFTAPERQEVVARLFPAGTISGSAFCEDGQELPGNVDLHVLPREAAPADPLDDRWPDEAVLSAEELALRGPGRDRFEVGPLEPGAYVVALRPATFERWTWAFGTEDGSEAGSLEITEGGAVDVGALPVDCGPAVRLLPTVLTGAAVPDLRDIRRSRDSFGVSGKVTTASGDAFVVEDAALHRFREVLGVRGLPEGEADLEIAIGHRYFLPDYWVRVPVVEELVRGGRVDVLVELADVGGSVSVRHPEATTARMMGADGRERFATFADGSTRFDNVPEASYTIDACADAACGTVLRSWGEVGVRRLETTDVVATVEATR